MVLDVLRKIRKGFVESGKDFEAVEKSLKGIAKESSSLGDC